MDIKKLAPWNWFKQEEEQAGSTVPVKKTEAGPAYPEGGPRGSLVHLHREIDRLFDNAFPGFGLSPFTSDISGPLAAAGMLKPQVDIGATDQEYTVTVEVPGVDDKDVRIEVADGTMTIRGEKKHEKEERDKNYYRMERSYGSFQRMLSLPDDADRDNIKARFRKGILTVTIPRKRVSRTDVKQIEIKSGE